MIQDGGFLTGSLIGDEMVLGQRRDLNLRSLHLFKLAGNRLFGFRISNDAETSVWQYSTIDLNELTELIVDVPFPFDGRYSVRCLLFSSILFLVGLLLLEWKSSLCRAQGLRRSKSMFYF